MTTAGRSLLNLGSGRLVDRSDSNGTWRNEGGNAVGEHAYTSRVTDRVGLDGEP